MRTSSKVVIFILVNILVCCTLRFLLTQPSMMAVHNNLIHEGDFDFICVGQSHAESSINPFIISEKLDCNAYNLSRRLMPVSSVYWLVKESNKKNNVKCVLYEIDSWYWQDAARIGLANDSNMLYILSTPAKAEYFFSELLNENFCLLFDYKLNGSNIKRCPRYVKVKFSKDYADKNENAVIAINKIINSSYEYKGRGFRCATKKSNSKYTEWIFYENIVSEKCLEHFKDTVNYCKEHDIELIAYTTLLNPYRLLNENYDDVHNYFTKLCNDMEVPFYDMNYVKSEYFSPITITEDAFVDFDGHQMDYLADKQTEVLCDILSATDKNQFFLSDFGSVREQYK